MAQYIKFRKVNMPCLMFIFMWLFTFVVTFQYLELYETLLFLFSRFTGVLAPGKQKKSYVCANVELICWKLASVMMISGYKVVYMKL